MAIKSTIVGGKQGIPEWMFPCLGKTDDGIIAIGKCPDSHPSPLPK